MTLNAGLIIYRSHAGLNEYLLVQSNSAEHNWVRKLCILKILYL